MSSSKIGRPSHPPFDPEVVATLEQVRALYPPFTLEGIPALRETVAKGFPGVEPFDLTMGGKVRKHEVTVPAEGERPELRLVVLSPAEGTGPWPGIYHTHGGGMILGSAEDGLHELAPLVAEFGAVVVSPDYRLAPEHPDPAPVEDCYAGLVWTGRHTAELGIDPGHLMIAGGSAGGGLAAGTALMARDQGFPALSHQILMSPMLDDRFITPSSRELDGEGMWDRDDNTVGWTALLGERRGGSDVSAYAAPARATDLSGLPRTFVDCGSAETFRDEAIDYAQRLSQAGVSVDLHIWGGGFHGSDLMALDAALTKAARTTRHEFFTRALNNKPA
ncbi:alpha/beta hydrolase [Streptomyces sp. NPDC026672]|uniref:alpha/beta hydrolase n=1 Tax=unclassified Streptomyces TaxID=2593676 RepID=UPI0033E31534